MDCRKLDLAADCYISALKIRHTRAHQGLARVHFLKNDKNAAYEEMTKLIEKAKNNASAYEKRSEYGDRDLINKDLNMVTQLDPLRVYPYRYRAAGQVLFLLLLFLCILNLRCLWNFKRTKDCVGAGPPDICQNQCYILPMAQLEMAGTALA